MSLIARIFRENGKVPILASSRYQTLCFSTQADEREMEKEDFRVLNLRNTREQKTQRQPVKRYPVPPPRSEQMSVHQDWGAVWPGPRTFHPATVPLPLRQGWVPKGKAPPSKVANTELMKIPNFLHLTPPVIKRQAEALKKFCTPWPKQLKKEEDVEKHFPVKVITSDYCHALPTIRNPLARIVSVKLRLSRLPLDKHAKDKFLRLVGDRYDPKTDILTIVTDRCPLRKQNYDYAMYLVTALFHESWVKEPWEDLKLEEDMEEYIWENNKSREVAEKIVKWGQKDDEKCEIPSSFKKAVENLLNRNESDSTLSRYKDEVVKLLQLDEKVEEK
ncbi:small ribosomal subunit protein mS35 [Phlebotomus argentipes]|uniref:small ribosomal subunit protein mS35 n=1 Tax=Phlebotomus argentipes TaxID=94469 RepID=UPI0028930A2F|nr:small ribosomal subunit protein mS35 [Phlebotomus argentipes]